MTSDSVVTSIPAVLLSLIKISFGDLVTYSVDGVEARERLLEDHSESLYRDNS